jgi:hypothetical protein
MGIIGSHIDTTSDHGRLQAKRLKDTSNSR